MYGGPLIFEETPRPVRLDSPLLPLPDGHGFRTFKRPGKKPLNRTATIDLKTRSLRIAHALSATVVTGPDKLRSGFGNGDCLLMDTSRGVFAVADASERHPRASRRLLTRLHKILIGQGSDTDPESLTHSLEEAYAQQKYNHKSTLSGIALSHTATQVILHLFHGGDSMVMVARADDGRILFSTRSDMNFAGRSPKGLTVATHAFSRQYPLRVILATDGFGEVIKTLQAPDPTDEHKSKTAYLKKLLQSPIQDVETRVRYLLESDPGRPFHDDMGVMVIDPAAINRLPGLALTMGGTSPHQEAAFAGTASHGWPLNELTDNLWQDHTEALRIAGIRFLPHGQ